MWRPVTVAADGRVSYVRTTELAPAGISLSTRYHIPACSWDDLAAVVAIGCIVTPPYVTENAVNVDAAESSAAAATRSTRSALAPTVNAAGVTDPFVFPGAVEL